MLNVRCPGCGANLRSKNEFAGKRVKCPKCGGRFEHTATVLVSAASPGSAEESDKSQPVIEQNSDSPTEVQSESQSLLVKSLDIRWPCRQGVITDLLKCFGCGIGSEYVYCYSYPSLIEIAALKGAERYRIKVGKADGDPIGRIYQQVGGNKTALSEWPVVLVVFQTLASRHLERWLHKRLERARDAGGSEWFTTNPDELVELFREYVRKASRDQTEIASIPVTQASHSASSQSTTFARMGPATFENDIVVFLRRCPARKDRSELKSERKRQGHHIHDVVERLGQASVQQLCNETGYTVTRILGHVNWAVRRGYLRMLNDFEPDMELPDIRKRAPGGDAARGARDAEGRTDKDRFFELWLESAKQGKQLEVNAVVDRFPNRSINTLYSWRGKFSNCGRGTTNRAYPRIALGRGEEIIEALRTLFGTGSLSVDDIEQIKAATTPLR